MWSKRHPLAARSYRGHAVPLGHPSSCSRCNPRPCLLFEASYGSPPWLSLGPCSKMSSSQSSEANSSESGRTSTPCIQASCHSNMQLRGTTSADPYGRSACILGHLQSCPHLNLPEEHVLPSSSARSTEPKSRSLWLSRAVCGAWSTDQLPGLSTPRTVFGRPRFGLAATLAVQMAPSASSKRLAHSWLARRTAALPWLHNDLWLLKSKVSSAAAAGAAYMLDVRFMHDPCAAEPQRNDLG